MKDITARWWSYLTLALFFGLASGLFEVAFWITKRWLGMLWFFYYISGSTLWLIPLADVGFFLLIGLVFCGLSRVVPAACNLRLAVFVFSGVLFAKMLFLFGGLHRAAIAILAVGLAVQTTRLTAKYFTRVWPVFSHGALWMVCLSLAFATVCLSKQHFGAGMAADAPRARTGAPNVLFISLDTLRAQNLSLYGYQRQTSPNLERWGKKGVVFEQAFATAPWTLPTHASLFTGRRVTELSTQWYVPLDPTYPTLAEVLSRNGYAAAGFVGNHFYCNTDTGLARGFSTYHDYSPSAGKAIFSSALTREVFEHDYIRRALNFYDIYGRRSAGQVTGDFLNWLATVEDQRPFFAFLNYFDVHDPYLPPAPFDSKFGPSLTASDRDFLGNWWDIHKQGLPAEKVALAQRAYDSCIAFLDDHVGKLLDELDRRGVLDNTVVVLVSDHGEHFGEHNLFCHGNSLYRELLHVPLVMIYPKAIPGGTRVADTVSLRDVPATLLELITMPRQLPGKSLARHWVSGHPDQRTEPSAVLSVAVDAPVFQSCCPVQKGNMVSLIVDGKQYIRNVHGEEELYDLRSDPKQRRNLIHHGAEELRQKMNEQLEKLLNENASSTGR